VYHFRDRSVFGRFAPTTCVEESARRVYLCWCHFVPVRVHTYINKSERPNGNRGVQLISTIVGTRSLSLSGKGKKHTIIGAYERLEKCDQVDFE
jgi:hypothetical protein